MLHKLILPIKKILHIFNKKQKRGFIYLFLGMVLYAILETLGVSIILPLVNAMVQPEVLFENKYLQPFLNNLKIDCVNELVIFLISGTVLLYLIKNVYFSIFSWLKVKFSCKIEKEIEIYMLKSYMNRGYQFFLKKNTNEVMTGVHHDVYNVYLIINSILYIITRLLIIGFIGLFMLMTDWKMATTLLIAGGLCVLLVLLVFRKNMKVAGEKERIHYIHSNQILMQTVQGIKEVLVMRKQKSMIRQYENEIGIAQQHQIKRQMGQDLPSFIIETLCVTTIMAILGVRLLSGAGESETFIAILASFAVGAFRIMPALSSVSSSINGISTFIPSLNNVYENIIEARLYNEMQYDVDTEDDKRYDNICFQKELQIKNIRFRYSENLEDVLRGININIKKGESTGLVGESGAGKSTLVDLLLGLSTPKDGEILMDDIPIRRIPNAWGKIIGFVPQTIYLSDMTIKENIAFGQYSSEIDEEQVRRSLEKANILSFVDSLPNGINTEIGERGVRLSGGQRQRLGIARALYTNPEILVLDEATSALDNDTEKTVIDAIESLQGEITLIIIAHRLTTLEKCDKIFEIVEGKAVERSYKELVRK